MVHHGLMLVWSNMSDAALHYNGSLWVAAGSGGIYYSSNGTSWTKVTGVVI